jgi:polar amino acid transport system substrate-binding protein
MKLKLCLLLMGFMGGVIAPLAPANAQQPNDPRVADLVHAGKVRVGLHLPQFVKDPATGEIRGLGTGAVIEQIAHALAARLGVELQLLGHPSPPVLIECLKAEACDVGFLGFVPGRTTEVSFAPPHMFVPFTYMVPAGSPIRSVNDADRPGIRIAVVRSHASTLTLGRLLKNAETVAVEIPDEAFELLRSGRVDAWAAPRPPLLEYSTKLPGSRVLADRYGENIQAIAVPKGQPGRLAYVSEFVERAKTSGFLQQAIARAGERGMEVAPPDDTVLTGSVPAAQGR